MSRLFGSIALPDRVRKSFTGSVEGFKTLSEGYTDLAEALGAPVEVLFDTQRPVPGTAEFVNGVIRIDSDILGFDPHQLDMSNPGHQGAFIESHGLILHEVAHALHSLWELPEATDPVRMAVASTLEDLRSEYRFCLERPQSKKWLRTALSHRVEHVAKTAPSPESATVLLLVETVGRSLIGLIPGSDVADMLELLEDRISEDAFGVIHEVVMTLKLIDDYDARSMMKQVEELMKIIDPSSSTPEKDEDSEVGKRQESKSDSSETDKEEKNKASEKEKEKPKDKKPKDENSKDKESKDKDSKDDKPKDEKSKDDKSEGDESEDGDSQDGESGDKSDEKSEDSDGDESSDEGDASDGESGEGESGGESGESSEGEPGGQPGEESSSSSGSPENGDPSSSKGEVTEEGDGSQESSSSSESSEGDALGEGESDANSEESDAVAASDGESDSLGGDATEDDSKDLRVEGLNRVDAMKASRKISEAAREASKELRERESSRIGALMDQIVNSKNSDESFSDPSAKVKRRGSDLNPKGAASAESAPGSNIEDANGEGGAVDVERDFSKESIDYDCNYAAGGDVGANAQQRLCPICKGNFDRRKNKNAGKKIEVKRRNPLPEETRLRRRLGERLKKAKFHDRAAVKLSTQQPPGRLNTREGVRAESQKAQGRMVTARPWKSKKHKVIETNNIRVAVLGDASGSIKELVTAFAVSSWAITSAVRDIGGKSINIAFGDVVGRVEKLNPIASKQVPVYSANGGTEVVGDAIAEATLDLDLLNRKGSMGPRLLVLFTDSDWVDDVQTKRADALLEALIHSGVKVILVRAGLPDAEEPTEHPASTIFEMTSIAEFNDEIGSILVQALRS